MLALYGKKLGMSQNFAENGDLVPVTIIQCGPCTVVQKKTKAREGYDAVQLGFEEEKKAQRVNRPKKGHFQKAKTPIFKCLGELRTDEIETINVGDRLGVEIFEVGDRLNIRGRTKGKGFQGVVKRHHKSGGASSHGSHFHRAPGSIGMCTSPARVIKNMGLPGHMGSEFRTVKNIEVVGIDVENNLLFVKGAVSGSRNGLVKITHPSAKLSERVKKEEEKEAREEVEAPEKAAEEQKES